MSRAPLLLLVLLLAALPVHAETPLTVAQAADAVRKAFDAQDAVALKALAGRKTPDPWLVVDELLGAGADGAAAAFAGATAGPDTARLDAYVTAATKQGARGEDRARLASVTAAVRASEADVVLTQTETIPDALDSVVRIRMLQARALALGALRKAQESESALERGAQAARDLGWLTRADRMLHAAGMSAARRFAWERAYALWTARLAVQQQLSDIRGAARTRSNLGLVERERGNHAEALKLFESALKDAETIEEAQLAGTVLGNIGIVYETLGDLRKALATYEDALRRKEATGDQHGAAVTLANMGAVYDALGNFTKTLAIYERVHEQRVAMQDELGAAQALGDLGSARHALGDYARALSDYERAIETQLALGDEAGAARTIANLAGVHLALGDLDKALATIRRAHQLDERLGNRAGAAMALGNMGLILANMGEFEEALAAYETSRAVLHALGRGPQATGMLDSVGGALHRLGKHEKALACYEEALQQYDSTGNRPAAAWARLGMAQVQFALGRTRDALSTLQRTKRLARHLRATPLLVEVLRSQAEYYLAEGDASRALDAAEDALEALEGLLGGLGEEQGATARAKHASLYALGTLAALQLEDVAAALTFLESGRAGALLDALGKRETLRWKAESLSVELRKADESARRAEALARRTYDAAVRKGRFKAVRAAGEELDRAAEGVRAIASRIQRELKQQAGLYYPRAETIEAIQRGLAADQALVLYGLCRDEALALVLRREAVRVVALGSVRDIIAACASLDATDPTTPAASALAALRARLIKPLALDARVKQILISPEGPLCYVPFGALLDRAVAMTPSGTTHLLLLEQRRETGKGVLALGAPDYAGVSEGAQAIYYRGRSLVPLPASRMEAETVGTTVLLGKDASEARIAKAIAAQPRWRAVHLACHGLVNVDKPMLSSLALSRVGSDAHDGFVTALEILRMRIPADLAVLSACETGKGRIVRGEGIVGLTRAFMFAGAPRVLCSQWKVDDEATRALMIKFYELWNPRPSSADPEHGSKGRVEGDPRAGLPAAEALRQAQAHIRAQSKWEHPYFWAAWVLWGLPE